MSDSIDNVIEAVEMVKELRELTELDYGLKCLLAWREFGLKSLGFGVGDKVAICDTWTPPHGWVPERECMAPGQTATVVDIVIHPDDLRVSALIKLDTEWSAVAWSQPSRAGVVQSYRRYGISSDNRHVFYFPAEHLRPRAPDDHPIPMPDDVQYPMTDVSS